MMYKKRVLAADDEPHWRERLKLAIESHGHEAVIVGSAGEVRERLLNESFDLLVTDNWMEEVGAGSKLLRELAARDCDIPAILFTSDIGPKVAGLVPYPWISLVKKDQWDTTDARLVEEIKRRLP